MNAQNSLSLKYRFEKAPVVNRPLSNAIERFGSLATQGIQYLPSLIPSLPFGRAEYLTDGMLDPGFIARQPKFEPYSEQIRIRCIENSSGPLVEYYYDKQGRISEVILIGSLREKYTWSDDGKLLSVSGRDLQLTQFKYRHNGLLASISYPNGSVFKYIYDEADRLAEIIYPDGVSLKYTHNNKGQPARVECRDGAFEYTWNLTGNIQEIQYHSSNEPLCLKFDKIKKKFKFQFYHETSGQIQKIISALGSWRYSSPKSIDEIFMHSGERLVKRNDDERTISSWSSSGQTIYSFDKGYVLMGMLNTDGTYRAFKRFVSNRSVVLVSALDIAILTYDEKGRLCAERNQQGIGASYAHTSQGILNFVNFQGNNIYMSWHGNGNLKTISLDDYFHASIRNPRDYPDQIILQTSHSGYLAVTDALVRLIWNWEAMKSTRRLNDFTKK